MNGEFHYLRGADQVGPVAVAEIASLIQAGQLAPDVLVWRPGLDNWQPANGFPEFGTAPPPTSYIPEAARQSDATTRALLPVDRSGMAIAAGYAALFGLVFPPAAWLAGILGWLGLRAINASEGTSKPLYGKGRAWFGIIVGIIWTLLTMLILAAALIAN